MPSCIRQQSAAAREAPLIPGKRSKAEASRTSTSTTSTTPEEPLTPQQQAATTISFEDLKVVQLREECKRLGLSPGGKKAELIARLQQASTEHPQAEPTGQEVTSGTQATLARRIIPVIIDLEGLKFKDQRAEDDAEEGSNVLNEGRQQPDGVVGPPGRGLQQQHQQQIVLSAEEWETLMAPKQREGLMVAREGLMRLLQPLTEAMEPDETLVRGVCVWEGG